MGLLPLEFTDCLTDSPYFRENLHAHEKELEKTSLAIKQLIKEVKDLVNAARGEPPVKQAASKPRSTLTGAFHLPGCSPEQQSDQGSPSGPFDRAGQQSDKQPASGQGVGEGITNSSSTAANSKQFYF